MENPTLGIRCRIVARVATGINRFDGNSHKIRSDPSRSGCRIKSAGFQKIKALFLRKESVPKMMESVPKWNDQEHILLVLKRFPSVVECFLFFQISYCADNDDTLQ